MEKDNQEPDIDGSFPDVLETRSDSEFRSLKVIEDTIKGIVFFFFQTLTVIWLMLRHPLYYGKNMLDLSERARIPQPFTFLAFSAVIASIGFIRFVSIVQLWFCRSVILQSPELSEVKVPFWIDYVFSGFCEGLPKKFTGISHPAILSSLRQIDFSSLLLMALPIIFIVVLFSREFLYFFKFQQTVKNRLIVYAMCFSAGFQLLIFTIATMWFSEKIVDCIFRDPGQSFIDCLSWSPPLFLICISYAIFSPVPILYAAGV